MISSLKAYLRLSNLPMFNWPRSHFYGNAWLVPPKTSTSQSMASCGSIDQRSSMLERRSQISLPTLLSFSLTVGHKVAHLYAWRKWLHCRRKGAAGEGSCSSRFTTSSVMAQIHTKKARRKGRSTRKGYEKRWEKINYRCIRPFTDRLWERGEGCWRWF